MEKNKEENVPQEGEFKMKKKPGRPKKLNTKPGETPKVDFNKKEKDAVQGETIESVQSAGSGSEESREDPKVEVCCRTIKNQILKGCRTNANRLFKLKLKFLTL